MGELALGMFVLFSPGQEPVRMGRPINGTAQRRLRGRRGVSRCRDRWSASWARVARRTGNGGATGINDVAVRKAVSYGVDRNALALLGESGYEQPAKSSTALIYRCHARCGKPRKMSRDT